MHSKQAHSSHGIPASDLKKLESLLASKVGFRFSQGNSPELLRGIYSASKDLDFPDAVSCVKWLISSRVSKQLIEILARHFTIGETCFFRDKDQLASLEEKVLPELIESHGRKDKQLKIWSAGCSTGEEAYTMAILVDRNLPDSSNWNVRVVATDANIIALKQAKGATYRDWSFRNCDDAIKNSYFDKKEAGRFKVVQRIRDMVSFGYLNLMEDSFPSLINNTNAIDMVVCKNVLMYFDEQEAARIVDNFSKVLMPGGWLILSAVEMGLDIFSQFEVVRFPKASFLRKPSTHDPNWFGGQRALKQQPATPTLPRRSRAVCLKKDRAKGLSSHSGKQPPSNELRTPPDEVQALYRSGRYQEVVRIIESTLSQQGDVDSPGMIETVELLVRSYANIGALEQAEAQCKVLVLHNKLTPRFRLLHAEVLQALGHTSKAKRILREAIYLDSGLTFAHFTLGNIALQESRKAEAMRHFRNARSSLQAMAQDDILPESDGMTVGSIARMIETIMEQGGGA